MTTKLLLGRRAEVRLLLAGSRSFGAAVFAALTQDGHEVASVVCPADPWDRLRLMASMAHVPWTPAGAGVSALQVPDGLDLIVAAHSHDFISKAARKRTRLGAVGYHPSLLPRHRGRSSVEWAVRFGDYLTGGSVYWLDDRIDAGDIAAQQPVWIRPGDDASTLWRRELFPLGVDLLRRTADDLRDGREVRVPQDEACATWEPAIDPPRVRRPDLPELAVDNDAERPVHRDLAASWV